jgi:hypothetical protein
MKIKDMKTGKTLWVGGKKGFEIEVSKKFWDALSAGKVTYTSGGEKGGIFFTSKVPIKIGDKDFAETLRMIAGTVVGRMVVRGEADISSL